MEPKLIFVYNADTGFFNGLSDFAHKIFSPKTYNCNLCKLTYGTTSMKKEWRKFIDSLPIEIQFLHRDEFNKKFPEIKEMLPAVFSMKSNELTNVITAKELNEINDLEELIAIIKKAYSSKI